MAAAIELKGVGKQSGSAESVTIKDSNTLTSVQQKQKKYWTRQCDSDSGAISCVHENQVNDNTGNSNLSFSASKGGIRRDEIPVGDKRPSFEKHLFKSAINHNGAGYETQDDRVSAIKENGCNGVDCSNLDLLAEAALTLLSISNSTRITENRYEESNARQPNGLGDSSTSLQITDAGSVAPLRERSAHAGGSSQGVPSESIPPQQFVVIPAAAGDRDHNFTGINFYKRIGKWTAHIWADKKQFYAGSYFTMTEAASAYDKASLKHFGESAKLNFEKSNYLQDLLEMRSMTKKEYLSLLQKLAKGSKLVEAAEGVHVCPKGWFEVRICLVDIRSRKRWKFLGRFDNLKDAKRSYKNEKGKYRA